jgi:hypothetical protein
MNHDDENDYYIRKEKKLAASSKIISYLVLAMIMMVGLAIAFNAG